jgi:hypothetical protein
MVARWLIPSIIALASGCALDGSTSSPGSEGRNESPIIDGVTSGPADNSAVWVGVLSSDGYPQGMCSGVLLADNVVLTARHCVSRTSNGGIACAKDGRPLSGGEVYSDYKATQMAVIVGPTMTRTAAGKGQQIFTTGATNLCNNDIAIVVLDRHIPDAVIAPVRLDAPPKKGENILAVGWGVSNNSTRYGRRRRENIPITAVGPATSSGGSVAPNEFAIGEGICSGDSGGPAYSMETGAVLGVVSRGGNGAPYNPETDPQYTQCVDTTEFETHNIYTRVDTLKDLIYQAFEVAGGEPWVEGSYDPRKAKAGETCDDASLCRSGMCNAGVCVDACGEGNVCPDGFTCKPVGDASACVQNATTPANAGAPGPAPKGKCSVTNVGAPADGVGWLLLASVLLMRRRR